MPRFAQIFLQCTLLLGVVAAAGLLGSCTPVVTASATSTTAGTTSSPDPAGSPSDAPPSTRVSSVLPKHIAGYDYRTPRLPAGISPRTGVQQMEVRMLIPRGGDPATSPYTPVVAAIGIHSNELSARELVQQQIAGSNSTTLQVAGQTVNVMDEGSQTGCTMLWLKDRSTLVYAFRAPCAVLEPIMASVIANR